MAVRGITFNKQLLKSEDFAHQTNYFYQGKMGVTKGCEISTNLDGDLVVSDGYFMIFGRQVANVGNTVVDVPSVASGVLYSKLVFTIDLTLENTITEFNQGYFEIVFDSVTYPTLIQEDLDNGGTKYQIEFYKFDNTVSGITNGVDTRTLLDLSMYALGEDLGNVDTLKTVAKTAVGAINEQNDSLASYNNLQGGTNYIPENANLNSIAYSQPGVYICSSAAIAQSLTNCPTTASFRLESYRVTGSITYENFIKQRIEISSVSCMTYERVNFNGAWSAWKAVSQITKRGIASITPSAANEPTSINVTFDIPFPDIPAVVATPRSSVAGTTILGVGVTNESPTGFTLWVTRTNTTVTSISWIAVY